MRTHPVEGFFASVRTRAHVHPLALVVAVLVIGIGSLILYNHFGLAVADTYTFSSQEEWESGEYWNATVDTVTSAGSLQMRAGGVGSWSLDTPGFPRDDRGLMWQATLEGANYGADLATDGTYIYMIVGGLQPELFRYNPDLGTWKQLKDAPTSFYYGAALAYSDGYIYASNGNTQDESADATTAFYRYSIVDDAWERLSDAPDTWGLGSDIVSAENGKIYAVRGRNTDAFWSYNTTTDTWVGTLPNIPAGFQIYQQNGHPLEFVSGVTWQNSEDETQCESGCLFAFRGNNQRQFFRFDIQLNKWYSGFADVPTTLGTSGRINYGSSMAYDPEAQELYAFTGGNDDELMKYDIDDETWIEGAEDPPNADLVIDEGGALVYLDDYIYALAGINRSVMMRYDVDGAEWTSVNIPASTSTDYDGELMAYVPPGEENNCTDADGCLYVARGRATTTFWRYDISTRTWNTLGVPANALGRGASLCYDGEGSIFATRGTNASGFYEFDLTTTGASEWVTRAGIAVDEGSGIVCMADNSVYALSGNNGTTFSHYTANPTPTWTADDAIPITGVNYGGNLVKAGSLVYALAGNYRGNFYQYDPSQPSGSRWTALPSYPASAYYNVSLVYDGLGNIIAFPGGFSNKNAYRYDISEPEWTKIADVPADLFRGQASALDSENGVIYLRRGFDTEAMYKFIPENDEYTPSVTWISPTIDLTYATQFNSFSVNATLNGQTITYESRTSDDQVSWSAWDEIEQGDWEIDSPAERYIQIKVTLNSNGTAAPSLQDFTINYEKDSVDPTNPTVTAYTDNTKATSLSASSYHVNPYFEFSGATDAESGVAGYYVLWTDDEGDDPDASEDYFQTTTSYAVSSAMEAGTTYFLRVASKDQADNVAAPFTAFTYTYTGISPATTKSWTDQDDFTATGTTDSNINTSAGSGTNLTLDSVIGGVWTHEAPFEYTQSRDITQTYDGDDTIYILESNNNQRFWAYSVADKTYTAKANFGDVNVRFGSSVQFVPPGTGCVDDVGCVYALAGNTTQVFKRYNIGGSAGAGTTANTWTTLDAIDTAVHYGGSLAYDGNNTIYALPGNNSTNVHKYTISGVGGNNWTTITSTDQSIRYGATLTFVPNGDDCTDANGCLYATRGNNDNDFYKYSTETGSWSYKQNVPIRASYGASAYYLNGYIYFSRGYQSDDFYRYDVSEDVWEKVADIPLNRYYAGSNNLVYIESRDSFYLQRGYNEYSYLRYDVSEDEWKTPAIPSSMVSNAYVGFEYGVTAYDTQNHKLYVARGNNSPDWYEFNPDDNTWKTRSTVPMRVRPGADAAYVNHSNDIYDGVYVMTGEEGLNDNVGYFYRYNTQTDIWTRLANVTEEPNLGGDLIWDGDDTMYAAQGAVSPSTEFYKYTISTNTWGVTDSIPAAIGDGACAVNAGNGYIYMTRGNNQDDIYRYDIREELSPGVPNPDYETWDTDVTLPLAPGNLRYADGCSVDNQGNILFPQGNNTDNMFVFDLDAGANGNWVTSRTVLQDYYRGDMVMTDNNVILGFRGRETSALERYVVATPTTGFEGNGSWVSEIIDFTAGVYGYGGLSLSLTDAADTSVTVETRTCSDAGCASDPDDSNWGEWTAATNHREVGGVDSYSVGSSLARYGQLRLIFVSEQLYTPTVHDYSWTYYTDVTAPTNPLEADGYTDSGETTSIASEDWTNDATPYFTWTATDNSGGIGVKGFHVYFGTNSGMDPVDNATDATNLAYRSGTNFYTVAGDGTTGSWDAATQSANTLTSETYYLKIKTEDYNGNISSTAVTAFTFQLDFDSPQRPPTLNVSPTGYSATNSFAFTWTAGSDTGGAGVEEYCYKTSEAGASETCVPAATLSVTGIQAYQSRANTFNVRSRDAANNFSDYRSVDYYYVGSAAAAPQNLVVTPEEQENLNQFAFSWSLPESCLGQTPCDAADILRYCYTINELPNAENCGYNLSGSATPSPDGGWTTASQTTNRSLPGFSAASKQGLNKLYLVAADAISNVDYDNVTVVEYEFISTAPSAPGGFQATDSSDRSTKRYSVTLTWDQPTDEGSGITGYTIYRCEVSGTNCDNPSVVDNPPTNYTVVAENNTLGYLDLDLNTEVTYSYFIRARGSGNSYSGNSSVVAIKPEGRFKTPPAITEGPLAESDSFAATFLWRTERIASSFIEYGLKPDSLTEEQGTADQVEGHEVQVVGLQPQTLYYYRIKSIDVDENIAYSTVGSFTTLEAPRVLDVKISDVKLYDALVSWTTNKPTTATIDYGPTTNYGLTYTDTSGSYALTHTVKLQSLQDGTTYNLRIGGKDLSGNTIQSDNYTFTTLTFPEVSDVTYENKAEGQTEVRWKTNVPTTSIVNYYSDNISPKTQGNAALTLDHAVLLFGLQDATRYIYTVGGADEFGYEAESAENEFTTLEDTTPPEVFGVQSESNTIGSGETSTIQIVVSWKTDEPTTSRVEFGAGLGATDFTNQTDENAELVQDHLVVISDLAPAKTYQFRVVSRDKAGNETKSSAYTVLTSRKRESFLQLVITNLEQTFSWLGNIGNMF